MDSLGRNPLKVLKDDWIGPHPTPDPIPCLLSWPYSPEQDISISEREGSGLTIRNCPNIRAIALENTQLKTFDFSDLTKLEYVYLSSLSTFMVGGGTGTGGNLLLTLGTLPFKRGTPGQVIVRGIGLSFTKPSQIRCIYKPIDFETSVINQWVTRRNWIICWDPVITEK